MSPHGTYAILDNYERPYERPAPDLCALNAALDALRLPFQAHPLEGEDATVCVLTDVDDWPQFCVDVVRACSWLGSCRPQWSYAYKMERLTTAIVPGQVERVGATYRVKERV